MNRNYFILLMTAFIGYASCHSKNETFDSQNWYNQIKKAILKDASLPMDIAQTEQYNNGNLKKVKSFRKGIPLVEKFYRETGEQAAETYYSGDGQFELRTEICSNGQIAFEGIFYKKMSMGLSTWWNCNKQRLKEGVRFKNQQVGIWKFLDSNGNDSTVDFGNANLIDSLQGIK